MTEISYKITRFWLAKRSAVFMWRQCKLTTQISEFGTKTLENYRKWSKFTPGPTFLNYLNSSEEQRISPEQLRHTFELFQRLSKTTRSWPKTLARTLLELSSIFFKLCSFRSSILLSLYVFIPREATLKFDSDVIFLDQITILCYA